MAWLGDIAALSKAWWKSFVAISGLGGSQVSYFAKHVNGKLLLELHGSRHPVELIANMVSR